jgi:hypothetical protein
VPTPIKCTCCRCEHSYLLCSSRSWLSQHDALCNELRNYWHPFSLIGDGLGCSQRCTQVWPHGLCATASRLVNFCAVIFWDDSCDLTRDGFRLIKRKLRDHSCNLTIIKQRSALADWKTGISLAIASRGFTVHPCFDQTARDPSYKCGQVVFSRVFLVQKCCVRLDGPVAQVTLCCI